MSASRPAGARLALAGPNDDRDLLVPEGDTIHKIANWLAPRLTGCRLERVGMADARAARLCTGREVAGVRARGKHLFVELDNRRALRSHLGMYGSWHFYTPADVWQKPARQATLVLETADATYVCFNAKEVELVSSPSVRERIVDARLGPDLLSQPVGADLVVRRARDILDGEAPLVDALLDQRVACGIGNVYKSEILFIEGLPPNRTLANVSDASLAGCFSTAANLLGRNLGGGKRVTRFDGDGAGRLWVYGRADLPCLRCDTPVVGARLGRHHRVTYWCPACQVTHRPCVEPRSV